VLLARGVFLPALDARAVVVRAFHRVSAQTRPFRVPISKVS
jgi:hypothetical protein